MTEYRHPAGKDMPAVYVALGSNLGDRHATLHGAIRRLRAEPGIRVTAVSSFYESPAIGGPEGQGKYLNAAATLDSDKRPEELLSLLQTIEKEFGRVRGVKDGPRTLDLDLLLHADRIFVSPTLWLPHPRMHERAFVLVPLSEIAPDAMHPVLEKSVRGLLEALPAGDVADCQRVEETPSVPQELSGLRALVTGSTSGIGAMIANKLAAHGARVYRNGRNNKPDIADYYVADLRSTNERNKLIREVWEGPSGEGDGLDILVCNAGADILTGEGAKWSFDRKLEELLMVDLRGTVDLARAIGEKMKLRGRGVVLTVGWDQAETGFKGDTGQLFALVKGAIMCFTRSLALTLAPEVRVNCLAPGWVRTKWGDEAPRETHERISREIPMRAWVLPDDVADAAFWLTSPNSRAVTGQTLRVNGGLIR